MAERGLTNLSFSIEDVHALSFPDDSFDVVHAHQVLQHVGDPVTALREMRRVAVPGDRRRARRGLRGLPLLPGTAGARSLARPVPCGGTGQRRGAGCGTPAAVLGARRGFTDITATASTWCYASPAERAWWGGMWADRILESALARQLVDSDMATRADLQEISDAWKRWADDGDGWYLVPHGEIIARA